MTGEIFDIGPAIHGNRFAPPEVSETVTQIICSQCKKVRTTEPDYTPVQPVMGQPLGWYSGDDGEICPDDMVKLMELGNRGHTYTAAQPA